MYQLPVCPRTSLRGRRDRSCAQSFGLVEVFWSNKQNKLKKTKQKKTSLFVNPVKPGVYGKNSQIYEKLKMQLQFFQEPTFLKFVEYIEKVAQPHTRYH